MIHSQHKDHTTLKSYNALCANFAVIYNISDIQRTVYGLEWWTVYAFWRLILVFLPVLQSNEVNSHNNNTKLKASPVPMFMWPTWGPPGSCRPQVGPMLVPRTLLSGLITNPLILVTVIFTAGHVRKYVYSKGGIVKQCHCFQVGVL